MSLIYKNKNGELKKVAGYLTQRVNARWFLCARVFEDGQEYYDVPENQTKDYFTNISPFSIYSFGFDEPNTTTTPKLRFKGQIYDIEDLTAMVPQQLGIGQLKGVYQMFTQESESDKTIYFIGDMHRDYDNIESLVGKTIQLGMNGIIEANRVIFTVENPETYLPYRTNLREFNIAAYLPIVVPNFGSLDRTLKVAIEFGDTVYNLYNTIYGASEPITIGDLMSTARYSQEIGFVFDFNATFFENSDITGFLIVTPAIIAKQLDQIIEDSDTIVTDISDDGTKVNIHLAAPIVQQLNRAIVKPIVAQPTTKLLAIDNINMQSFIGLGDGLEFDNNTIKLTPAAPFVSYNAAQTLTPEQQAQARANIGAGTSDETIVIKYSDFIPGTEETKTDSWLAKKTGGSIAIGVDNDTVTNTIKFQSNVTTISSKQKQSGGNETSFLISPGAMTSTMSGKGKTAQFTINPNFAFLAVGTEGDSLIVELSKEGGFTLNEKRILTVDDIIPETQGTSVTVDGKPQTVWESNVKLDKKVTANGITSTFNNNGSTVSISVQTQTTGSVLGMSENSVQIGMDNGSNSSTIQILPTSIDLDSTSVTKNGVEIATIDKIPTKTSSLTNDSGFITVNSVPTKTSQLTNDSGFITSSAIPTALSELSQDETHRLVTDTEKASWNNKLNSQNEVNDGVSNIDMGVSGAQLSLQYSYLDKTTMFDIANDYVRSTSPIYITDVSDDNKVATLHDLSDVVHKTGNEDVGGTKNFTGILQVNGGTISYDSASSTFII